MTRLMRSKVARSAGGRRTNDTNGQSSVIGKNIMSNINIRINTARKNHTNGVLEIEAESETESFLPAKSDDNDNGEPASSSSSSPSIYVPGNQRKILFLILVLAASAGLFVTRMDKTVESATLGVDGGPSGSDHIETKAPKTSFHSSSGSFGGINNIAHPGGAKAASKGEGIAFEEITIPKANVGHAIISLNRPNIVNSWGHYVHDEHRSPYASHLYKATKEELQARQDRYVEKMKKVREEWGAWDFRDPRGEQSASTTSREDEDGTNDETNINDTKTNIMRSAADFSGVEYKDLPVEDFPPDAWQADEVYVARFLDEAKKLVARVKEGIYAEHGWPTKGKEGDQAYLEQRNQFWKINIWDPSAGEVDTASDCIASLTKVAFDGLVRKLLHGLMTNDEFYAVLAGHSAAAGHGNDFIQNRMITFHHLMEPLFDKLGMRLVSRNMGMGGVGTLHFSLAGGDLYGETDILEWDSGMTEKGPAVDFFNKQAILSGERVPLIMTDYHFNVMEETKGTALMGRYVLRNEKNIFPDTTYENAASQPYAARWMNQIEEKYNAICWEPRSDVEAWTPQREAPGSQVSWHPGFRNHKWAGRKTALILLEALGVAFERWEEGIAKEGIPLAASYWHVGESYKTVRENLRTHINTPAGGGGEGEGEGQDDIRSECEKMIPWLPRLCRVQMHGFGLWTPRVHTDYDFLNIIHKAPNGFKPEYSLKQAYKGFDVLPLNQAIPDGEIDVHAIAIATTSKPPDLDHGWIDEEESNLDVDGDLTSAKDLPENTGPPPPPSRRWLRKASELGFQKGRELFPPASTGVENVKKRSLKIETGNEKESVDGVTSDVTPLLRRRLDENAPVVDETAPLVDPAAPVVDAAAPVVDEAAPVVDATAPVVDATAPVVDEAALVVDAAAPVVDAAAPVVDAAALVVDEAALGGGAAAPVVDETAPVVDEVAPVVDAAIPVVDATAPVVDTAAPAADEVAPLVDENVPVMDEDAPVVDEAAPVVDEVAPMVDAAAPLVDENVPVMDETAPVVDEAAPVMVEAAELVDENVPVMDENAPVVDEAAPVVVEAAPVVDEAAPVVDEAAPVMDAAAPVVDEAAPVVDEVAPVVDEAAPMVDAAAPLVDENIPVVDEDAPVMDEAAPVMVEAAELVNENAPVVDEAAPVVVEATPVVDAADSVVDVVAPVMDENVPLVDEAAPVVDEAAPGVDEAVPVVAEAVPVVNEAAPVMDENAPVVDEVAPVVDTRVGEGTSPPQAIVPGRGWALHSWVSPNIGLCDGSAQSECHRNEDSDCLIYNTNDSHLDVWGSALSGWLVFTVPKVREGIILARMEWWCGKGDGNELTAGWTEVNGGMTDDTTPWEAPPPARNRVMMATDTSSSDVSEDEQLERQRQRNLKKPTVDMLVPLDFEMDIAINGEIVRTMKRKEWLTYTAELVKNVSIWPLLDDPSMAQKDWDGEPVEVGIRFRSTIQPQQTYCVSHVYYA